MESFVVNPYTSEDSHHVVPLCLGFPIILSKMNILDTGPLG